MDLKKKHPFVACSATYCCIIISDKKLGRSLGMRPPDHCVYWEFGNEFDALEPPLRTGLICAWYAYQILPSTYEDHPWQKFSTIVHQSNLRECDYFYMGLPHMLVICAAHTVTSLVLRLGTRLAPWNPTWSIKQRTLEACCPPPSTEPAIPCQNKTTALLSFGQPSCLGLWDWRRWEQYLEEHLVPSESHCIPHPHLQGGRMDA